MGAPRLCRREGGKLSLRGRTYCWRWLTERGRPAAGFFWPQRAAGGVGSALLRLGRLAGLEMYGTCSSRGASAVSHVGCIPIYYQRRDFVKEVHRLTREGVDVVFDSIGGTHIWRSRKALRPGGKVVAYGLTSSLREGRLASGRRHRFHGIAIFGLYIAGGWLIPAGNG
jgi:NADPH:quinone reductase-like Zn-dependent oxidoreductase